MMIRPRDQKTPEKIGESCWLHLLGMVQTSTKHQDYISDLAWSRFDVESANYQRLLPP